MNKNLTLTVSAALLLGIGSQSAMAQKPAQLTLQPPPSGLKIDGSLDDWGDSLRYYNEEKKLNFTLANDHDNLYMAIRLNDRMDQARVLGAGLTLSINTKGKKKETFTLTFPVMEKGGNGMGLEGMRRRPEGEVSQADRDELAKARLTKLRDIKVSGFKDIETEIITTTNTYGIKAAINYDANGYLIYETAIPLKFFGDYDLKKNDWAFNIKINGLTRPTGGGNGEGSRGEGGSMGGSGGRRGGGGMGGGAGRRGGGMGGGGGRAGQSGGTENNEMQKSTDFWVRYYLNPGV